MAWGRHSSFIIHHSSFIYALASGSFCVWLAAFMPSEGPRLTAYIPSNAEAVMHVRDGASLLALLRDSPAWLEFKADPDANELFHLADNFERQLARHEQLPAVVRRLFPATLAGLHPLFGHEWAFVRLQVQSEEARPGLLLLTRLSGSRGMLGRLALSFVKAPKNIRFFDLGGGLVALGVDGATPRERHSPEWHPLNRQSGDWRARTFARYSNFLNNF